MPERILEIPEANKRPSSHSKVIEEAIDVANNRQAELENEVINIRENLQLSQPTKAERVVLPNEQGYLKSTLESSLDPNVIKGNLTGKFEIARVEAKPKSGLDAEFVGFPKNQEKKVKEYLKATGLPNDDIRVVAKEKSTPDQRNTIAYCQPYEGKIGVLDNFDKLEAIGQAEALTHEHAHMVSEFIERNEKLYGSPEAAESARQHTIAVAKQSLMTRKFMSGYQAHLAVQLKRGEIDEGRFIEETGGILLGLRFTNPNHVREIDAVQKKAMKRIAPDATPVSLMTTDEEARAGKITGVDQKISSLIPSLKSKAEIDNHITSLKRKYGSKSFSVKAA